MTNVTEILSREHQVVLGRLDALERALDAYDVNGLREALHFFDERLVLHRRKEEEVLFPALGAHIGTEVGPVACMLEEHRDEREKIETIRDALRDPSSTGARDRILAAGRYILELLRHHIQKEDRVLFPMAESVLSDEEKKAVKSGMDAIGYCCPECAHH